VIKRRIVGINAQKSLPNLAAKPKDKPKKAVKEIHQNTFTGSLSQYYYGGKSQDRSVNSADEVTNTNRTDQSTIITNISATERIRNNQYDTKIVIRDTQVNNLMTGIPNSNTLSTAYIEHANKAEDYMVRVGRQSGVSQGVLGRFDGVFARYGINLNWRVAGVYGEPAYGSRSTVQTDRYFYGLAVEFGPIAEKWSGSVFGIQQIADGLVERRAIGTELRYFNGTTSWFGTVDYDTIYNDVNIAMLQGNWKVDDYNYSLVLDHRRSPILYAESAIPAVQNSTFGARSVKDLRTQLSDSAIYDAVNNIVPTSDLAMFGITKQINAKWQLGGDVRYTKTSSTPGALDASAQASSGSIYAYTLQAIARELIFKNDTSVMMASFMNDPTYDAQNYSFVNSLTLQDKWRLDSSLRYYQEKRETNARTWRVSPGVRVNYYWKDNMSFEMEFMVDYTHTNDPVAAVVNDTWRETLFAGYRWDIR